MSTARRTLTASATLAASVVAFLVTMAARPHDAVANPKDTIADIALAARSSAALLDPVQLAMTDARSTMQRMSTDAQFQKEVLTLVNKNDAAGLQSLVQKLAPNSTVRVQKMQDFFLVLSFEVRGHTVIVCASSTKTCEGGDTASLHLI